MIKLLFVGTAQITSFVMMAMLMTLPATGLAQEESPETKIRGKVIGRIWHTNVDGSQFFSYTRKLSDELQLPTNPIMMMMGGGLGAQMMNGVGRPGSKESVTTRGTLILLETAPQAGTPRFISFQSVKDHAEYLKLLKEKSGSGFGGGELIGEGDRHEVRLNLGALTNFTPGPNDEAEEDEGTERKTMSFSIRIGSSSSSDSSGAQMNEAVELPTSISTFYRYHDGFMYSGQLAAVHTMDLPAGKTLIENEEDASLDLRAEIDLREIPRLLKQQLWMSLQTRAMTYLQRFDNEKAGDHAVRSALGKGRLELLKAAMFDVDEVSLAIKFSGEAEKPVTVKLNVTARDESQLATTLAAIGDSRSSLINLRDQDSALMLSSTVDLPDWTKPLATYFAKSVQAKMAETANDESTTELLNQIFVPIVDTLEQGQLDAVVSMDGDAATGATVIGGIKLLDSESFQTALETLLVIQPVSDGYRLTQSKAGQQPVLTVSTTAKFAEDSEAIPVMMHLAGAEGYLWFSIGGDSALEVLKQHLDKSATLVKSSGTGRPLEVRLKLSQWLGAENSEFSKLPEELLKQGERLFSTLSDQGQSMSLSVNGETQKLGTKDQFKSYAKQVLGKAGSDFELKLQAQGRQLDLEAEVGTQVVKFLVAQYVVAQNRMFQNIKFDLPDLSGLQGAEGNGTRVQTIRIGR